ncbi:uncharacterized protein LOC135642871 [Musa acuminata AAA Group]|uniref:uncharacterized protein LOC135642871 n=1 Tax=Musa acuminata AAA Group TaxID=214697 RepID=UPI0031D4B39C
MAAVCNQRAQKPTAGLVEHAVVVFEAKKGPQYYGASADLEVFQLSGVSINQASTSQIILTKGERGPKNYINTVQAGWQSDGYQKTGCINLDCHGFVQDRFTSNWMLYNDREPVGYWPKEIFNNMADSSQVQMGGLVYSPFDEASPPMGNGVKGEAKFTNVLLLDGQGNNRTPEDFEEIHDLDIDYYYISYHYRDGVLNYGGPGGWKKT